MPDTELARRAAGGDGAAFVRLYDGYSADIFKAVLVATASVDTASAATQTAFLKLLSRPPALGAPDSEVGERLRALAIGAGVEGAALTRPVSGGSESGWLRSETITKAGEHFDEDWSVYLTRTPAAREETPDRMPAPPPVPAIGVVAEYPLAPAPPYPQRRSLLAVIEDLPLRAAGIVVLFLAALTLGAAVVRMNSENPNGATDAAVASDTPDGQQPATGDGRQDGAGDARKAHHAARGHAKKRSRGHRRSSGLNLLGIPNLGDSSDSNHAGAGTRPAAGRRGAPHRVVTHQVAGQRRASAPTSPRRTGGGGGPVNDRGGNSAPAPAPAPQHAPEPAPAPAPAPEPAPAPAPAPTDTTPSHGQGHGYGHDKPAKDQPPAG